LPAQDTILQLRELPRTKRAAINLPQRGLPIVDINSQIEIRPNLIAIQKAGEAQFPRFFQDKLLGDKIARINNALQNQQRIIELTRQLLDGLDVGRDLRRQLRDYVAGVKADPQLRADFNRYLDDFDQQFSDPATAPDPFVYSLQRFNAQLDTIKNELKNLQQTGQIQFSVVAFRRDASGGARVHVENFDEFQNGEYFSVNRWVTTLSENDRSQLENLSQLAQGLNQDAKQVLNAYKDKIINAFPAIDCVQHIRPELDSAIHSLSGDLKGSLEKFKAGQTGQIAPLFTGLLQELRTWQPSQSPTWENRLATIFIKLDTISQRFNLAVGDTGVLRANQHLAAVNACLKQTLSDFRRIQQLVERFPYDYLNKVNLRSEEIAAEVLAFNLEDIPPLGTIDLEYTGQRKSGDELLIKAVFRLPGDSMIAHSAGHSIEVHRLKMILVGAHTTTKVGVIVANSYTVEPPPDTPKFRFAPSAALLLKFGSRRSHFYNNFLDLGIGLNTAAPDFDLDGKPEFSAGVTGTIFRDILSIGWAWNFGLDRPNFFLGIHLPFNLPGVPVNTVQNNPL
ncbi:MAG: hypothetical protein ABIQ93_13895, partial [Saprospiraceae bacterium]